MPLAADTYTIFGLACFGAAFGFIIGSLLASWGRRR